MLSQQGPGRVPAPMIFNAIFGREIVSAVAGGVAERNIVKL